MTGRTMTLTIGAVVVAAMIFSNAGTSRAEAHRAAADRDRRTERGRPVRCASGTAPCETSDVPACGHDHDALARGIHRGAAALGIPERAVDPREPAAAVRQRVRGVDVVQRDEADGIGRGGCRGKSADARDVVAILKESPVHMGLVYDEYGAFQGVVTSADGGRALVRVAWASRDQELGTAGGATLTRR